MKNLYIIITFLLSFAQAHSQNGPGGVGSINSSDVMLWLKADDLSNLNDGDDVTQWDDITGYGNNATAVSGNEPTFNSSGSYPVIDFANANSDFLKVTDDPSLNPTAGLSMFVVGKYTASSADWSPFIVKIDNSSGPDGYGMGKNDNNDNTFSFVNTYNGGGRVDYPNNSSGIVRLMEFDYDKNSVSGRLNEGDLDNNNYTDNITSSTNNVYIGTLDGTQAYLDGSIAEIVLLNRGVNDAERIIVSNYLHGKYNIPLSDNQFWTYDTDYKDNIIGIGVSDASNTHAESTGDILTILQTSNATTGYDGYLMVGHNGHSFIGDNCGSTPESVTFISDQLWKFSFSGGFSGDLTVKFDLTTTGIAPLISTGNVFEDNEDIKLLFSTSTDFGSAGVL